MIIKTIRTKQPYVKPFDLSCTFGNNGEILEPKMDGKEISQERMREILSAFSSAAFGAMSR